MSEKKHLLFVYGTLKRGYGNNARLADQKFLGTAVTAIGGYVMQDVGFPLLWLEEPDPGGHRARGEIFEVSDNALWQCDSLEGHPNMYRREKQQFVLRVGDHTNLTQDVRPEQMVEAWVYLWQGAPNGDPMEPRSDGAYVWNREQVLQRKVR